MSSLIGKKFTNKEVTELLRKQQLGYELSLSEQKDRIFSLLEEVESLKKEVESFKIKDEAISSALVNAVEKAKEIESIAKRKHQANIDRLKIFESKLVNCYKAVVNKYPLDDNLISLEEFLVKMDEVLGLNNMTPKKQTQSIFGGNANVSDGMVNESGFDILEALNPSNGLEEICRDLGLME